MNASMGDLTHAAFFLIRPKRDRVALQALMGKRPLGVLGTDRAKAYGLLPSKRRQFCWAHLKRDFQATVDRQNEGSAIGKKLLIEGGAQPIRLSTQEDARFRKAGAEVTEARLKELEGKGLPARAVYSSMKALAERHAKSSKNFWN